MSSKIKHSTNKLSDSKNCDPKLGISNCRKTSDLPFNKKRFYVHKAFRREAIE